MKLDKKLCFVAPAWFAGSLLICLTWVVPATSQPNSPPIVTTGPIVVFTQLQPEMVVFKPYRRPPRPSMPEQIFDPVKEFELMRHRSLDLIDMRDRYQPRTDLKESDK